MPGPAPAPTHPTSTHLTSGPSSASSTGVAAARREERAVRRERTATLFEAVADEHRPDVRAEQIRQVVVANMGVAEALAARHRGRGIPVEDLEQVAYVALVRAAGQFDAGRSDDFLTYAVPCIKGELRRHFRDHGWMVRPPRPVQEAQSRVVRARDELAGEHGGRVPDALIAEKLDIDVELVRQSLAAEGCFHPVSLDAPLPVDVAGTPVDAAVDDTAAQEQVDARVALRPVLRHLEGRERRLLLLRYFHDRTQQEIADELGLTQTQVSRLLAKVLRELRSRVEEHLPRAATA